MIRTAILFVVMLVLTDLVARTEDVLPLKLVRWLPVEGPPNSQPSGLIIRDESLFTVSDKHDTTIFRIELGETTATMKPAVEFQNVEHPPGRLDFEGITLDDEGNFCLVSETLCRILRVKTEGKDAAWITPSLRKYGEEKGMFATRGAFLEGITYVGGNRFVVCAERQPRGLLEVIIDGDTSAVNAYTLNTSIFEYTKGRAPDFADLFWDGEALYTLERNAYVICRMERGENGYVEGAGWSYKHIVTQKELRYQSMRFGHAEGLCLDDEYVYVIIDNNGQGRELYPDDKRPILLIMERPYAPAE